MLKKSKFHYSSISFFFKLITIYLLMSFSQRVIYLVWMSVYSNELVSSFITAFFKGIIFDLISGSLLFIIPALLLLLTPKSWLASKIIQLIIGLTSALSLFLAFFMALAEGFFFAEFHARYNFIAVDYLVYSKEVLQNAIESYPLQWILLGLIIFWLPFAYYVLKNSFKIQASQKNSLKNRLTLASILIILIGSLFFISEDSIIQQDKYWTQQLSKNTLFSLFSAYNKNAIDFHQFYTTLDKKKAFNITHEWLEEENLDSNQTKAEEDKSEDEYSIVRNIKADSPTKRWNVIVVIIESMSAKYMGYYGSPNQDTKNLDRLARQGLNFDNMYATGTRTVRGLEALMLSLPPTPGQSILRRPKSDGLFNLGQVFKQKGYKTQFIYGGYSYFDNMKNWFESNGFEVVDRASFPSEEIHFSNVWGVCDEDLFSQVLKQGDQLYSQNKNFFQAVLTTSNHRPYTYPDGKIDIPSHTGRRGAVKYTDFAIGEFVKEAEKKPWFKNTLLVFVADHNGSVAGGADIPVNDYHIPMIFYNPNLVKNTKVKKLGSQIDFAPSLLGLMGFSYQSRFFGQNLFKAKGGRALLGTYQKIALMNPGKMTVLLPIKTIESQTLDSKGKVINSTQIATSDKDDKYTLSNDIQKTIAIYQTASELFESGESKINYLFSKKINLRNH